MKESLWRGKWKIVWYGWILGMRSFLSNLFIPFWDQGMQFSPPWPSFGIHGSFQKRVFFFLHDKLVTTKCWLWIIFRKRGWGLANRCVLCKCEEKSIYHILIHCVIVRVLWLLLCPLLEFVWVLSSTVKDILLGRCGSFVVWNRNMV